MEESTKNKQKYDTLLEQLSFEAAFAQLENIVSALETEEKPLEDALALFERGQVLARHCTDLLDHAELRVKQLSGGALTDYEEEIEAL